MEFNYTVPVTQPLYGGANFTYSDLSWGEKKWVDWYTYMGNPAIATGVMSFVLHELVYFGRCLPWIIIDAIPYFRKWKIQPGKIPTAAEQWSCTKHLLLSHFTVQLPQIWLFHPVAEYFGMRTHQVPFPDWKTTCWQLFWFFIMEDAWHYVAHQALHYGPLYRHIHKIHHKYSAPFGLAAEYAHPLEMIILGVGTVGGPILYTSITHNFHIVTMYIWICLRLFQAIDAHSGYDFPWSLHNIFPLWSGAEHHDYHHMAFTNNFSTSFRYLDFIFGTDDKYRAYKARLREAKSGDRAALEKQLIEQTEREGIEAERIAEKKWFGSKKSD
ncbi:putative ERG25-C-4 methyl sterol oxidase [Exidia glandulosa HHB12029]|uniref:Putative ERG25-C-4 methyl sterol oxidase n=1 Tax=Exidia glandulosa HHB12029 TaxID=1314781 RepID=A0A165M8X2_EXIGL|nr:putative ERG25-C-4 methyl sterol oxidase [Exidia glandulosa HHB12029]